MKTLMLEEIVSAMGGRALGRLPVVSVASVSTDSRTLRGGELFFALRGEHFDGHAYVDGVLRKGAVAAVVSDVSKVPARWHEAGRLICVSDVVEALGRLASYHRMQVAAQVIAVAGSNGKTTTKGLIDAVLSRRKRGRAAPRSFNNAIGVPLTLLSVASSDEYVVVEIGTNHPGEVAKLAQLCRPDLGVITSIGEEHLEFFGDVRRVAEEELSLLAYVRPRGFVALHAECGAFPASAPMRDDLKRVEFGFEAGCDLRATEVRGEEGRQRFKVNGRFEYSIAAPGAHNVTNALAAVAVGLRFGLSHEEIARTLASAEFPPMRLERSRVGGVTLINDAYNANPSSVRAALACLEQMPESGRRVLILGDMRELGPQAARCHDEIGRAAGRSSARVIIAIGAHARTLADGATATAGSTKRIYSYPSVEVAGPALEQLIEAGDVVLMKGSRALRLERLVPHLERCGAVAIGT